MCEVMKCRQNELDPNEVLDWGELDASQQAEITRRLANSNSVYFNSCLSSGPDDLFIPATGSTSSTTRAGTHMQARLEASCVANLELLLQAGLPCNKHRLTLLHACIDDSQVAFAVATTLGLFLAAM